jgi:peroxiredoxin family protein
MEYRLDKQALLEVMEQWNHFMKRKVHLVACGGTAMTLLGVKASTKDVDFMVPIVSEYGYLLKMLIMNR